MITGGNTMKKYRDTETGNIITEEELQTEFEELKSGSPEEYNYTFSEYIRNCTAKNGFLEEIKTLCVCNQCLSAIAAHEGRQRYEKHYIDNPIICDWCEMETECEINELL